MIPLNLDSDDLIPALQQLVNTIEKQTGVNCRLDADPKALPADSDAAVQLYRIAQEALTNIERHSGATRVRIDLRGHRNGVTLRIADNGAGLKPDQEQSGLGLGLRNMQERIEQLDGTLRILSSTSGTVIEAEVPLSHLLRPDSASRESA